nr:MAG TPA: hypothetical protein [Caudoviricetes sp.]
MYLTINYKVNSTINISLSYCPFCSLISITSSNTH